MDGRRALAVAVLLAIGVAPVSGRGATAPFLVRDIDPGPDPEAGTSIDGIHVAGDQAFFQPLPSEPLWRTDGTAEGTQAIGNVLLLASETAVYGGDLYFTGVGIGDGAPGVGLWRSDGTAPDALLVRDFPLEGAPEAFAALSDVLLFLKNGAHGRELWRTDGTGTGTILVAEVGRLPFDSTEEMAVLANDAYFFAANDSGTVALWRSDGTAGGTREVAEVRGSMMRATGGLLWFAGSSGQEGTEPWVSDGTPEGTRQVADLHPGAAASDPREFTAVGDTVYFSANDGAHGFELFASDTTDEGTILLDIVPGSEGSSPQRLAALGSSLGLLAQLPGSQPPRYVPFIVDQQHQASPIATGSAGGLVVAAGRAYFWQYNCTPWPCFSRLWTTDGTLIGTFELQPPGVDALEVLGTIAPFRDGVLFVASDHVHGQELWFSDGTHGGTRLVRDITERPASSSPFALTAVGERVLFFAGKGHGRGLWSSDGTEAGTSVVTRQFEASDAERWASAPGALVFAPSASDSTMLWRSDGSELGTFPLISGRFDLLVSGREDVFLVRRGLEGGAGEPWISDGTIEGTVRVASVTARSAAAPLGAGFVFAAAETPSDTALWWSGARQEPARSLFNAVADAGEGYVEMAAAGPYVFFLVEPTFGPRSLWRTDGTSEGTRRLREESAGKRFSWFRGQVYFIDESATFGREVWVTDGSAAGTQLAFDLLPGRPSSLPDELVPALGSLFFTAHSDVGRRSLWRSDGTAPGTRVVVDIDPLERLIAGVELNRNLYFVLLRNGIRQTLWRTDGSTIGTVMVAAIGAHSQAEIAALRPLLLFRADSEALGTELFAVEAHAPPLPVLDCDVDGVVSPHDVRIALELSLGLGPTAVCSGLDPDGNGVVTVEELVGGVKESLDVRPASLPVAGGKISLAGVPGRR